MFKRVAQLSLGFLLLISLNVGVVAEHQEQAEEVYITINQAIELALKYNLDFYLAKLDLQQAESSLERANMVADAELVEKAEEDWAKQLENYEEAEHKLVTSIRRSYFETLEKAASIESATTALERAEKQREIDQAKFKAGLISPIDIQRSDNSYITAKNSLDKAILDHETKLMELNQLLGLAITTTLVLTEDLTVDFIPFNMELDEAYQRALEFDKSISVAREGLQKAEDNVVASNNPYTPLADLEKAKLEAEKAKIKLKQAENTLYFKIRSDYFGLKNAELDIYNRERELELETQVLRAEEAKYNAGMISNEQVVKQQEKVAQLEQALIKTKWNYQLTKESFLAEVK